jgi:hypothetical protein
LYLSRRFEDREASELFAALLSVPQTFQLQRKVLVQRFAEYTVETTKNVAFSRPSEKDDLIKLVIDNSYELEQSSGQYSRAIIKLPQFSDDKSRRSGLNHYQKAEVIARISERELSALAALYDPAARRSLNLISSSDSLSALETFSSRISDSLNLRFLIGTDLSGAPEKLEKLVRDGDGIEAGKLAKNMALFSLLFRSFASSFVPISKIGGEENISKIFSRTFEVDLPIFMFPHGIVDDALQFHFATLYKDAALYVDLGATLNAESEAREETLAQVRAITGMETSSLPEMYRSTARWIKKKFVYYSNGGPDNVLTSDLLGSDIGDSMEFKFDFMIKAFIVSENRERVNLINEFVKKTKHLFEEDDQTDYIAIAEKQTSSSSTFFGSSPVKREPIGDGKFEAIRRLLDATDSTNEIFDALVGPA